MDTNKPASPTSPAANTAEMDGHSSNVSDAAKISGARLSKAYSEHASEPDERALFTASYTVDLPLLERYARLNICRRQQTLLAFLAITTLVVALMLVTAQPSLWPISAAFAAFGILMVVWHRRLPHTTAQRLLQGLSAERRARTIAIYEDRTVLSSGNGTPRTYPMEAFRELRWSDKTGMAVLVFGQAGVTVPREALTAGTWGDLIVWGETHCAA